MIFFFKQKTAYEIGVRLVGSEMCIRDSLKGSPDWELDSTISMEMTDLLDDISVY